MTFSYIGCCKRRGFWKDLNSTIIVNHYCWYATEMNRFFITKIIGSLNTVTQSLTLCHFVRTNTNLSILFVRSFLLTLMLSLKCSLMSPFVFVFDKTFFDIRSCFCCNCCKQLVGFALMKLDKLLDSLHNFELFSEGFTKLVEYFSKLFMYYYYCYSLISPT